MAKQKENKQSPRTHVNPKTGQFNYPSHQGAIIIVIGFFFFLELFVDNL